MLSDNKTSTAVEDKRVSASTVPEPAVELISADRDEQARLLLVSLLENFCALYDRDPQKNNKLFLALCKRLNRMGILRSTDFLDEGNELRSSYRIAFRKLVLKAIEEEHPRGLLLDKAAESTDSGLETEEANEESVGNLLSVVNSRFMNDFCDVHYIGRGGYGVVVKARNVLDQRLYAVKKIPFRDDSSSSFRAILREVKSLASFDHANIVRYYSAWIEECTVKEATVLAHGGSCSSYSSGSSTVSVAAEIPTMMMYIQMELCQFTLEDYIKQRNAVIFGEPLPGTTKHIRLDRLVSIDPATEQYTVNAFENRRIFKGIVKGLYYVHSQGLMHRDLKPHNILFASGEAFVPKISDFGLASDAVKAAIPVCDLCATRNCEDSLLTGGVGTSTYAPPEQLHSGLYNEKADVYSLGIIFFELFCPFKTQMERVQTLKRLREQKLFPPNFVKAHPKEAAFIWSCLSHQQEMRPSCSEILESELVDLDADDVVGMLAEENENLRALLDFKADEAEEYKRLSEDYLHELECLRQRLADLDELFDEDADGEFDNNH